MSFASRRSLALVLASVVVPSVLASCGGGGGGGSKSPMPVSPITSSTIVAGVQEDRSPIEAPDGLVVQLHVAPPRAIAHAIKPAIGVAVDPRDVLADMLDDPTLAQLVDVDAPVDAAVVAVKDDQKHDGPYLAYAFGMEEGGSLSARLGDAWRMEPKTGGAIRLVQKRGNGEPVYYQSTECWILPAIGPAQHRLVCGEGQGAVAIVGPWLARGVTRRSWPDALGTAEVDLRPLRVAFGDDLIKARDEASGEIPRLLTVGKPALDKVTSKLAKQLVDEGFDLLGDVDAITLSLGRKQSAFQVTASVVFGRSESWIAKAALANSEGVGGAPPMLGKVPADGVRSAVFSHPGPTSEALLQPWQAAILQLVEATAVDYAWPKKDEDAALELVRAMFPRVADGFSFTGGDHSAWDEGPNVEQKKGRKWLWQKLARPDWTISELERDAKPTRDFLKAFGAVITSASFADTVKKVTDGTYALKATSKTSTPKGLKDATAQIYEIALTTTESPMEPVAVEMPAPPMNPTAKPAKPAPKPTPKAKPKTKETTLLKMSGEAIVVASGTRSWTAWGWNVKESDLVARLQHAMAGDSTSTLSQRATFDFLSAPNASSGAWIDLSSAATSLGSTNAASAAGSDADAMSWRVSAQKSGQGGTATVELLITDEAIGIGKKAADDVHVPWF